MLLQYIAIANDAFEVVGTLNISSFMSVDEERSRNAPEVVVPVRKEALGDEKSRAIHILADVEKKMGRKCRGEVEGKDVVG